MHSSGLNPIVLCSLEKFGSSLLAFLSSWEYMLRSKLLDTDGGMRYRRQL